MINNILICGIGGVGGYFGGKIAHKIAHLDNEKKIYFLARGQHLEEIKNYGLKLHLDNGEELICKPTLVSDNIEDIPVPDLCLICVKSYDLDDLMKRIKKKILDHTIIIPLMNGIDIYERIRKNINNSIVLPSCVYIGSHIEKPGVIKQSGNPGFFYSGFDPNYPDFNPQIIIEFFKEMEISMHWQSNPYPAIWGKYLLVASFALVSAYKRRTMGEIIYDMKSRRILEEIMKEIILIAKKIGINFPNNIIENIIEFCKDYPDVKPSYLRDIEKGKKDEGDLFGGTIIRMGKSLGIATPMTISIYKENIV